MAEKELTDLEKTRAQISKLMAETEKINNQNRWSVAVVASGATLAIVAVVKLFF